MEKQSVGSCLCGEIRFKIEGDFETFFLCHCKYCQKDTGSAHAANLFSTKARLIWVRGEDKRATFDLPKSRHSKSFCRLCGSAIPNLQMGGELLVVPAGSLDSEVPIKPTAHIFISSKANWEENIENIAKIDKLPDS